jgi:hypothetical protein
MPLAVFSRAAASVNAGEKIDRVTPWEGVMRRGEVRPPDFVLRTVAKAATFVGHRGDVHSGDLRTCSASSIGGRQE